MKNIYTILFLVVVIIIATLSYYQVNNTENMNQKYDEILKSSKEISLLEIEFIDMSFQKYGNKSGSSFGDYSVGLEKLSKDSYIKIIKKSGDFIANINSKDGAWEFNVTIDGKTGEWKNPSQYEGVTIEPPQIF